MSTHVCPYWAGCLLASPLRRLIQNPEKILAPYVSKNMIVLEIGPGMGFFTLPLAEMVGPQGKVICVDIQEKMIQSLQKRLARKLLSERTITRVCKENLLGINDFYGKIDFALLFAVVHEIPDIPNLFSEIAQALKPAGSCLLAEPKGHVSIQDYDKTLAIAKQKGLNVVDSPQIPRSYASLIRKN